MRLSRCDDKPRLTYMIALLLLAIMALWASRANAQSTDTYNAGFMLQSGATYIYTPQAINNARVGIAVNGAPTTAQLLIQGCMATLPQTQGTVTAASVAVCDNVEIWQSTANGTLPLAGLYDYYLFTATFTGGTAPNFNVKVTSSIDEAWSTQVMFSPTQLGITSQSILATSYSTYGPIISMANVRALAGTAVCTAVGVKLYADYYAEDFATQTSTVNNIIPTSTSATFGWFQTANASNQFGSTAVNPVPIPAAAVRFYLDNTTDLRSPAACT